MILKKLYINRGYGSDGALRGEIEFKTDSGNELKLTLDERLSQEIVKLCADAVARAGKAAAEALTADAISQNLIEHEPS
jgi:recombinational DNA repair protein RecT